MKIKSVFRLLFCLTICLFSNLSGENLLPFLLRTPENSLPVDISFIIVDYKYNEIQGVQICEIQSGSLSAFRGYDFIEGGKGTIAQKFVNLLDPISLPFWYVKSDICDKNIKNGIDLKGAISETKFSDILTNKMFLECAQKTVFDRENFLSYQGLLYVNHNRLKSFQHFLDNYPAIILFDAALFPYLHDKYSTNCLLSLHPTSNQLKPHWNLYKSKYSNELTSSILSEFSSEVLVIKPLNAAKGRGIIITYRDDLDSTLKYILDGENCENHPEWTIDSSYNYWRNINKPHFLVEEFVESDPVYVEHLDNKPYDATARAVVLLTYQNQNIDIQILGAYWKLPKKSISDSGNLIEKHKSFGEPPHFYKISPLTLLAMEDQLRGGLSIIYRLMLGIQ